MSYNKKNQLKMITVNLDKTVAMDYKDFVKFAIAISTNADVNLIFDKLKIAKIDSIIPSNMVRNRIEKPKLFKGDYITRGYKYEYDYLEGETLTFRISKAGF
jgi:stalled ribosome alternative rescue factor ArfA